MGVSENVQRLRKAQRLSVAELAQETRVSKPYIWQIESGRRENPTGEVLQRLARGLGVTVADLLGVPQGVPEEELEEAPESLRVFYRTRGKKLGIRREDLTMLRHIHFRGRRPDTEEDWELIYLFLKRLLATKQ